jgi:hypothetical protein
MFALSSETYGDGIRAEKMSGFTTDHTFAIMS